MGIGMFDFQAVMSRAGSDQNIMGRRRLTCATASIRKSIGSSPNLIGDRQVGDALLIGAKQLPVGFAAHSGP